jgi:hypothetical protein
MAMLSLNCVLPVFGCTVTNAVPLPEPSAGDWIPNCAGELPGNPNQEHPGGAVTVTGITLPNASAEIVDGLTL